MSTIKRNITYSVFLTGMNYLFPLIVYPYVSRVLGVEKLGLVSFINSLTTYFILFSMLGISVLGAREVARNRGNAAELSKAFSNLLRLQAIFTLAALILMAVTTLTVESLWQNRKLMAVGMCKLVANLFIIEWLYVGLEKFKYITYRSIIIKVLYVVSIFIFVRTQADYITYFVLTMLVVVGYATLDIISAKKYISFAWNCGRVFKYLKPMLAVGTYVVLGSFYTTFNVVFLGFMSNDTEVGYYSTAVKLLSIIIAMFGAITTVMYPRMTVLFNEHRLSGFKRYFIKTTKILVLIAIPIVIIGEIFTTEVVLLISGPGYEGAVTPLRIILPFVIFFVVEQLIVMQALMPMRKDRAVTKNACVVALLSIAINILIVKKFGAVGSAIAWSTCETIMCILSYISLRHVYGKSIIKKSMARY